MSRKIKAETKIARKMGKGEGKDYLPYITTSEFNSLGTTSVIVDWKTGRGVHCLSQGEANWYYILRWDDENFDIREQFPMSLDKTIQIAKKLNIRHPGGLNHVMTIDFLVTRCNGKYQAYSVKPNRESLTKRTLEILCIEKLYWESEGVEYFLLFSEDINKNLVNNIRSIIQYYDEKTVFDDISKIKHNLARKKIVFDLNEIQLSDFLEGFTV